MADGPLFFSVAFQSQLDARIARVQEWWNDQRNFGLDHI